MTALILVDLQNDFLPHGSLQVKDSEQILPIINRLLELPFDEKVATKDWHEADHGSFADTHHKLAGETILLDGVTQILWPQHCVQGTLGAEFSPLWHSFKIHRVFHKGTEQNIDSYSAFFDNGHRKSTELDHYLKQKKIHSIFFAGLTTDYCVKYSVLDALQLGFKTYVIKDACRAVNLTENDERDALDEMHKAGAVLINCEDVIKYLKNG